MRVRNLPLRWTYRCRCSAGRHSSDDEPPRRRADEVERIAGDQRQRSRGRGIEHGDILRVDNPRSFDTVHFGPVERFQLDGITRSDVFQDAKETVTVPGNACVALRSRLCGVLDVTDAAIQRDLVSPFEYWRLKPDSGNAQDGQRDRTGVLEGVLPREDPSRRPETLIRGIGLLQGCRLERLKTV